MENIYGGSIDYAEGVSWRARIIIASSEGFLGWNTNLYCYRAKLKAIYTEEMENPKEIDNTPYTFIGEIITSPITQIGEGASEVVDNASKILKVIDKLSTKYSEDNIIASFTKWLIACSDGAQKIINLCQDDETSLASSEGDILYKYNELQIDTQGEGASSNQNKNKYTNVSEYYGSNYTSYSGQKCVYVDGEEKEFSQNTKIPIIPVDIYNIASGNIEISDYNFLIKRTENSALDVLKNMVATIIHVIIYIAVAFLLIVLIWHGINVVKSSLDNPQAKVNHREGIKRFCVSLIMLIGSIVIMALSIYMGDMFLEDIKSENDELPIRVNVSLDSGGYSFSTNFSGYVRFMTQSENEDLGGERLVYAIEYFLLVGINALCILVTGILMFVMLVLSIIGPIIATLYSILGKDNRVLSYQSWAKLYIGLSLTKVVLALACKIALECF